MTVSAICFRFRREIEEKTRTDRKANNQLDSLKAKIPEPRFCLYILVQVLQIFRLVPKSCWQSLQAIHERQCLFPTATVFVALDVFNCRRF